MGCSGTTPLPYSKSKSISVWLKNQTEWGLVVPKLRSNGTSWSEVLSEGALIKAFSSVKIGVLAKSPPGNVHPNWGWLYFEFVDDVFATTRIQVYLFEETITDDQDYFAGSVGWYIFESSELDPQPEEIHNSSCAMDARTDLITFTLNLS
jgi:hypothetical protein